MKKKIYVPFVFIFLMLSCVLSAREITGREAQQKISGAEKIITSAISDIPEYIQFRAESQINFNDFENWAHQTFALSDDYGFRLMNTEPDQIGMVHYRYRQTFKDYDLEATMCIVHVKNGKVVSVSATLFNKISAGVAKLDEATALSKALGYMGASLYRWQIPQMEQRLKGQMNSEDATWFPKGELMMAPQKGVMMAENFRLCWRFDIYAEEPMRREYVFVDVTTGEVIHTVNRIHDAGVVGTALTAYSGTRTINTDSTAPGSYRLREAVRGNGIETYNLNKGTTHPTNVDFTDADNYWNNVNANEDQYATDAHWGAEMTYDFYKLKFNRNGIDNAGFKLFSYVHYSTNYTNAFWNGTEMTYGDGGGSYTPLTSLDVTGHEITHGFTEKVSGLSGGNEPGALNEGFSDCFGNSIRYFAKQPATMDWQIGDEIGGAVFRDMKNPKSTGNPDTYKGTNWDPNQEVHKNSTVLSHCYYLLVEGGSGTNDISSVYNVTGIGLDKAQQIWYRMNDIYFMPSTGYVAARAAAIQAAIDIYGACSNEVIQTTNAWYAVGVGAVFAPGVTCDFTAPLTSFCSVPASVIFTNTSTNAGSFVWDFGDGFSSTASNPTHVYNSSGIYSVTLMGYGGTCGSDTTVKTQFIQVNLPVAPTVSSASVCAGSSASLTASGSGVMNWYSNSTGGSAIGTGSPYVTPALSNTTTYYAESDIVSPPVHVGRADSTFGAGGNFNLTNYHQLYFDCYSPVTLVSVKVYATGAGNRKITLIQNGVTLDSVIVNIPDGQSRVTLNFPVPAGTNFELGMMSNVNLYRNGPGVVFPYTINGVISITHSNATGGYYYYFYDWIVQAPPCSSVRVPVTATVNPSPTASFTSTITANNGSFVDNSTGAVTYHWDFGDPSSGADNTSSIIDPPHVFSSIGSYQVCLTVTNSAGCSNTICKTITITSLGVAQIGAFNDISVYPNPVSDKVTILFPAAFSGQKWVLQLSDMLGKILAEETIQKVQDGKYSWDLSTLSSGAYILIIQSDEKKIVRKIVHQ